MSLKRITFSFIIVIISLFLSLPTEAQTIKTMFMDGINALQSDHSQEAAQHFEDIIKIKPDFAPAYNFLGMAYMDLGRANEETLKYFEKAIMYDPQYAMAYENMGKVYYSMGDIDKALNNTLKALQFDPDLLTARLSLGWIYLIGKGQPKSAIRQFKKVVDTKPLPYACLGLGLAYFQDHQLPLVLEMITYLRKAGEETYAQHLENMIKQNRYIPPRVGATVLDLPKRSKGVLVTDAPSASSAQSPTQESAKSNVQDIMNMPVYLKGKMPGSEGPTDSAFGADNVYSPTETIHTKQQRGAQIKY